MFKSLRGHQNVDIALGWMGTAAAIVGAIIVATTNSWHGFLLFIFATLLMLPIQFRKRVWSQVTIMIFYLIIDIIGIAHRI